MNDKCYHSWETVCPICGPVREPNSQQNNLSKYLDCDPAYAEDVEYIITRIPLVRSLPRRTVQELYSEYSDRMFSASWMSMDEDRIQSFKMWLDDSR